MSAEELKDSHNKEKDTELFKNGTGVDRFSEPAADKSLKNPHDENSSAELARSTFTITVDEAANKSSRTLSNCCAYLKQNAISWIEIVFIISICTAVAVGFTIPIIIYAVDTDRGSDNSTLSIDLDVDNCPSYTQVC